MKCEDGGGDGDGDVLSEDGGPDHLVPGPDVHQAAEAVAQDQEGQTAHQAVHRHQLQTVVAGREREVFRLLGLLCLSGGLGMEWNVRPIKANFIF